MGNVPEGNWVSMTGRVKNVSGQQFTIENRSGDIAVNINEMNYNPLDEQGLQRVSEGDRVYVSGILDNEFFDNREIDASTIITLSKQQRRQMEGQSEGQTEGQTQTPEAESKG
jgi:uncharacterized protein YdeI (BOF family)